MKVVGESVAQHSISSASATLLKAVLIALFSLVIGTPVIAQEDKDSPALSIELNGAAPSERGCRLTFVVNNQLEQDIGRAAYEVALFGTGGLVEKLMVLDFKALPAAQTKVRQFDLAEVDCSNLGRVLVNGVTACAAADQDVCTARLETAARGKIAFGR